MPFNCSWTKKELQNECRMHGIRYQGLSKTELIHELNCWHDELNPQDVDHSWTKKELKAECFNRGLRNYGRLTKDALIQLLNTGTTMASTPRNRRDRDVWVVNLEATELLVNAREAAEMRQWGTAIQRYASYLDQHSDVGDAAWQDEISSELDQCVLQHWQEMTQRREAEEMRADLERREAEWRREAERRREEEARAAAAEAQARRDAEQQERLRATEARAAAAEAEERREAQRRREAECRERLRAAEARAAAAAAQLASAEELLRVAAAEAAAAGEDKERRLAELQAILPAPAAEALQGRGTDHAGAPSNECRGAAPGRGSTSPGEARSSVGSGAINNECSICMDAEVNCTLVPCCHHVCCYECAATFDRCPVCRDEVRERLQTFGA